jgi:Glucose / Sorbosone dehydrogenase
MSATLIERGLTRGRSVLKTAEMKIPSPVVLGTAFAFFIRIADVGQSAPVVLNTNLQIRLVMNTTNSSGQNSVRIAKDPRNNQLYYLKINGDIFRVNLQPPGGVSTSTKVYSATDHGLSSSVEGLAIGPDGTIYVLGNNNTNSSLTYARIRKGVPNASGVRTWSLLAQTQPYPRSATAFDHLCNGMVVSPDGQYLYMNSGARTDHGEEQSNGGLYPGVRDVPLTAKIFRLPTSSVNLTLTNDLNLLRQAGYIFSEGTRNSFDLAFGPNGDLFATDNGPDRDMSESLYWLRAGLHFGFPWRIGGADNPQQFPTYDPSTDKLLDPRFIAVSSGYYHNDPTFPPPPTNFADPVISLGPDADSYRDPADGSIKNASSLGQSLHTFTAHRSPLGLSFDKLGAMASPFQNHGFVLSWTPGDPNGNTVAGPFADASQDLLDLNMTKLGSTNYQATITRIISGFSNPIDSEIIGNRIYIIEYGGNQGIWEVTFPPALPDVTLSAPIIEPNGAFQFTVTGTGGLTYEMDVSSNLVNWSVVTNVVSPSSQFQLTDLAPSVSSKFYRVLQH